MSDGGGPRMPIWTGVLALALGVAAIASVLQPPQSNAFQQAPERVPEPSTETAKATDEMAGAGAAPSREANGETSGPKGRRTAAAELPSIAEIKAPCDATRPFRVGPNIKQIRVTGAICLKSAPAADPVSEIKNASNGFVATAFFPQPRAFTTDYISLSPGSNKISIAHSWGRLTENREIVVERR